MVQSNQYEAAFTRIVQEHSTYYLLGFNSSYERRDGRYINLEVRVKRPALQVRSIDGYLAPRGNPAAERRPGSVLAAVWDAVASPLTTSGISMRMFAAPFRRGDKEAVVTISLEIDAARLNLLEHNGAHRGELEIVFAVTDAKKKKWPLMRHRAALALKPSTYERVSRSALRVVSQLTLPEGRYQLRASAGGAALAGSVVYDLEIPDFRDDFRLSGIALTSLQAAETLTVSPHAKMDVDLPGPPTTAREFSREDTVTLFVEAYENRRKPHVARLGIELRDASGRAVATHALQRQSAAAPTAASVHAFAPSLTLEDVRPGRYTLRVEASSSLDSRRSLAREIPITVR